MSFGPLSVVDCICGVTDYCIEVVQRAHGLVLVSESQMIQEGMPVQRSTVSVPSHTRQLLHFQKTSVPRSMSCVLLKTSPYAKPSLPNPHHMPKPFQRQIPGHSQPIAYLLRPSHSSSLPINPLLHIRQLRRKPPHHLRQLPVRLLQLRNSI